MRNMMILVELITGLIITPFESISYEIFPDTLIPYHEISYNFLPYLTSHYCSKTLSSMRAAPSDCRKTHWSSLVLETTWKSDLGLG